MDLGKAMKSRNLWIAGAVLGVVGLAGVTALALGSGHKAAETQLAMNDQAFGDRQTKSTEHAPNVKGDFHQANDPNAVAPHQLETKNTGSTNVALNTQQPAYKDGPFDVISFGAPTAPIVIVEYGSLSCPHCAHFAQEVLPQLKARYIDKGTVRLIFRPFVLGGGHEAIDTDAGLFITCLPANRRAAWVEVLYNQQNKWIPWDEGNDVLKMRKDIRQNLENYATKQAAMSSAQFQACLENQNNGVWLQSVRDQGEKDGVDSTPTFFINNQKYGPMEFDSFVKVLDPLVAKAQGHG